MQHTTPSHRSRAILLLGPTASGKTPLGEIIQQRGLWGAPCVHFDFGANLREVVARGQTDQFASPHSGPLPVGEGAFSREEIDFLRKVLRSGALLEDEQFPIARRILQAFITRQGVEQDTHVVLNGLPRHVGQARAIDDLLDVRVAVHLECSEETVLQRIRTNVGGDRGRRNDDDPRSVRHKLAIFHRRTAPLLDHYRQQGARVVAIRTTAGITAEQMWQMLQSS